MNEPNGQDQPFKWPDDCWYNDEILLDMNAMPEVPVTPRSEKYLAWARAERAKMARWDPEFRAQLELLGIKLMPEELADEQPPQT